MQEQFEGKPNTVEEEALSQAYFSEMKVKRQRDKE